MEYIKEPKGVDFVVEPHVVTEEDRKIMTQIISDYKATGKKTRSPRPKKKATQSKKTPKNRHHTKPGSATTKTSITRNF